MCEFTTTTSILSSSLPRISDPYAYYYLHLLLLRAKVPRWHEAQILTILMLMLRGHSPLKSFMLPRQSSMKDVTDKEKKGIGDKMQTLVWISNSSEILTRCSTWDFLPIITATGSPRMVLPRRAFQIHSLFALSKDFSKSMKTRWSSDLSPATCFIKSPRVLVHLVYE